MRGYTREEFKKIKEKALEEFYEMTDREKQLFHDAFRASRDDKDESIEEAIDYALEVYEED